MVRKRERSGVKKRENIAEWQRQAQEQQAPQQQQQPQQQQPPQQAQRPQRPQVQPGPLAPSSETLPTLPFWAKVHQEAHAASAKSKRQALVMTRSSCDSANWADDIEKSSLLAYEAIQAQFELEERAVKYLHRNNIAAGLGISKTATTGPDGSLARIMQGYGPGTDLLLFIRSVVGLTTNPYSLMSWLHHHTGRGVTIKMLFWASSPGYTTIQSAHFVHEQMAPVRGGTLGVACMEDGGDFVLEPPKTEEGKALLNFMKFYSAEERDEPGLHESGRNTTTDILKRALKLEVGHLAMG